MTTFQWLVVFGIIAIIIWWLMKKPQQTPKKDGKEIIGTYEGWMITWMQQTNLYPNVRGENAMMLVYGRADVYSDGYLESNPESYRMTYQQEGEMIRRYNPHYDDSLLARYKEKQGGMPVRFVDGTQRYMSQLFGVRKGHIETPKSLAKMQKSTG